MLANYAADDAIIAAGEHAELLYVRGLAFCATSDSDGYVTEAQVVRYIGAGMKDALKRAERLVECGLWVRADGGFQVRSWLRIHTSSEERGRARKLDRERKAAAPFRAESERNPSGIRREAAPDSLSLIQSSAVKELTTLPEPPAKQKPNKPRDDLWEALLEACGVDPVAVTASARGAANQALKQIRDVGGTVPQVRLRAHRFRELYPSMTLTPAALAKHWPQLTGGGGVRSVGGVTAG